jgi:hypothetical protein
MVHTKALSKAKITESPPLSKEEIKDIKAARKSKDWKTYTNYKDLIKELNDAAKLDN